MNYKKCKMCGEKYLVVDIGSFVEGKCPWCKEAEEVWRKEDEDVRKIVIVNCKKCTCVHCGINYKSIH